MVTGGCLLHEKGREKRDRCVDLHPKIGGTYKIHGPVSFVSVFERHFFIPFCAKITEYYTSNLPSGGL